MQNSAKNFPKYRHGKRQIKAYHPFQKLEFTFSIKLVFQYLFLHEMQMIFFTELQEGFHCFNSLWFTNARFL